MHTFIDESGSFAIPAGRPKPAVSCIGALSVSSTRIDAVYADFATLSAGWPNEKGEIKGRLLGEPEIAATLRLLSDHHALFTCVAFDLGLHRHAELLDHLEAQAQRLEANLTDRHQSSMIAEVRRAQATLRGLSAPDYCQMVARTELLDLVLRTVPLYKCQREGADLGDFAWTFDAKDKNVSRMEGLWDLLILGYLESRSLADPWIALIEGDWTDFNARYSQTLPAPPEHLRAHTSAAPDEPFHTVDIRAVLANRRLGNSSVDKGLQLVDCATSAVRRGMQGNLRPEGWRDLGRLTIQPLNRRSEVIKMARIGPDRSWTPSPPYFSMLSELKRTSLPLLLP